VLGPVWALTADGDELFGERLDDGFVRLGELEPPTPLFRPAGTPRARGPSRSEAYSLEPRFYETNRRNGMTLEAKKTIRGPGRVRVRFPTRAQPSAKKNVGGGGKNERGDEPPRGSERLTLRIVRVAALLGLVVTVAALSRLPGHAPARTAPDTSPLPLPRAATVAKRGMSEARVRRLAGEPAHAFRYHGERCLDYIGKGFQGEHMLTLVCLDGKNRVSSVRSEQLPHSVNPTDI
jgi:hypothetical protein